MISDKSIRLTFGIPLLIIFLAVACATRPSGDPEAEKSKSIPASIEKTRESPSVSLPAQRIKSAGGKVKSAIRPSPDLPTGETPREDGSSKIDWGREATLDEVMAMAKSGEIQQVEWHVMPNVIRAQALDGRIYHIRNENKGIDIRATLTNAGIHLGKGGIVFRHVFWTWEGPEE